MKKNILIVYAYRDFPLRVAIKDHLYSFKKHSDSRCFYLNIQERKFPVWLSRVEFDLIIFHTIFLSSRWNRVLFKKLKEKLMPLKEIRALKAALPQDEFVNMDQVRDFIGDFNVEYVFSVSPPSEWEKIYRDLAKSEFVKIKEVLTGYISESRIDKESKKNNNLKRKIDIGYRAWKASFWLGKHGQLKSLVADKFKMKSLEYGLKTDISTRDEDTIKGEEWFDFLRECKYTIGVEGGSSILDDDGSIRERTEKYLEINPGASFKEVENNCFPGIDGNLGLFALSPRHFEACLTKTCQILVEGEYNGIFKPWVHYIPIDKEFKSLEKILDIVKKDDIRKEIAENAFRDIVLQENYTYKKFVQKIFETVFREEKVKYKNNNRSQICYFLNEICELSAWAKIYFYIELRSKIVEMLPKPIIATLKRLVGKRCAA
ncbi:hypothetical protein JXA84_05175 [candidate division WOR-3 bacterium]|nr:hypothetical protein [candidate division WOR-3 bacterium]